MKRIVQAEMLDSLSEKDQAAIANRGDLRLINWLMGNHRWFCHSLPRYLKPEDRILEIGAGTGELGMALRERCRLSPGSYSGLDLWERPQAWPSDWDWIRENLIAFDGFGDFDVLLANLILHQFDKEELVKLGKKLAGSSIRLILACEPARRRIHQWQLKLLYPLGLHPVSRHDSRVSVAAGFKSQELAAFLRLEQPEWHLTSHNGFFGWNRTIAIRKNIQTR